MRNFPVKMKSEWPMTPSMVTVPIYPPKVILDVSSGPFSDRIDV